MPSCFCYPVRMGCVFAALTMAAVLLTGCEGQGEEQAARDELLTVTVNRQDIVVQVTATGQIEPIRTIEIKSKASGKILRLPVETGDVVQAGALLAQVDTTEAATQARQRHADLEYVRAQFTIADTRKERAADLFRQGMISKDEYDQEHLNYAQVRSSLVSAEAALEAAEERLGETIVRAPIRGTILAKSVEEGQIISSAMTAVTGGTTLMRMADLARVQVRVLIDESDLGKVQPGQEATVRVEAYPDRQFTGSVLKVEPEGREERDIIFFPVLIQINNEEGLLRPVMNANVEIHIARRESVLALSNDAVKNPQDAKKIAPMLGIEPDSVEALIAAPRATTGEGTTQRTASPDLAVVFVADTMGFRAVVVRTGTKNWEYTEIVEGLGEGAEAIIPPSPVIAEQFAEFYKTLRRWRGLPGRK